MKTYKSGSDFQLWPPPPASPAKQFTSLDIKNSLNELREELWPLLQNMLTMRPTKIVILQDSWFCLQDYRSAGCCQKTPLDDATDREPENAP